jgi:hypothetical protein
MIIGNYTGDSFEKFAFSICNPTFEAKISYAQASPRFLQSFIEYL